VRKAKADTISIHFLSSSFQEISNLINILEFTVKAFFNARKDLSFTADREKRDQTLMRKM
jgi:hypothetical protein